MSHAEPLHSVAVITHALLFVTQQKRESFQSQNSSEFAVSQTTSFLKEHTRSSGSGAGVLFRQ